MTTAANWFATAAEFRTVCDDAVQLAETVAERELAAKMLASAKAKGLNMPLNEVQVHFICAIACVRMRERVDL